MSLAQDRQTIIVIASVIIILALVTVALVFWTLQARVFERNGIFHHHYYVRVEANSTEEYTFRLPVPNDTNGRMPYDFVYELEVLTGEPVFALGNYEHGKGLEGRASGYLEFEWSKTWSESRNERYGNLTMTVGAEGWNPVGPCYSWMFSDRSDIRVSFNYFSINEYMVSPTFASGGGPTFSFCEYPDGAGWQKIAMDYGWMLIN